MTPLGAVGPTTRRPGKRKDPDPIDDDEFERLQQTLFRDKGIDKDAVAGKSSAKNKRARRARKP